MDSSNILFKQITLSWLQSYFPKLVFIISKCSAETTCHSKFAPDLSDNWHFNRPPHCLTSTFISWWFCFYLLLFNIIALLCIQGPEWGAGRRQRETPGAPAPPALVQPGTERGAGWSSFLDPTEHHPRGDQHTGARWHMRTHLSLDSREHWFWCNKLNFLPLRAVTAVGQLQGPPTLLFLLLQTAHLLRRSPSRKLLDPMLKFDWHWFHKKRPPVLKTSPRFRWKSLVFFSCTTRPHPGSKNYGHFYSCTGPVREPLPLLDHKCLCVSVLTP